MDMMAYLRTFAPLLALLLPWTALAASARHIVCAGATAPGLAYPDASGHWAGLELRLCTDIARQLGSGRPDFVPILQATDAPARNGAAIVFLPEGDIPAGFQPGPVIFDNREAIMVPAGSPARDAADLAGQPLCVEPGSPEEAALADYFAAHRLKLDEFVFQEVDEMHDAYLAGRCAGIVAPVALLGGLRANAGDDEADRILPDDLADNPVRAAFVPGDRALERAVKTAFATDIADRKDRP